MNFAGLIFHLNYSLCVKIFPAGMHNNINWDESAFSSDGFDFYTFKDSEDKKAYVEYEKDEEFNIEPLHLKETIRYKCVISDEANSDFSDFNPRLKNESNKFLKIERDDNKSLTFQFINYLGKSELTFDSSVGEHTFSFEIIPDKISYKEDYVNLTNAIAEECSALLLDYSSPTVLSFTQDSEKQQKTALEQFIFLRQFCYEENLESLFASIKRNPDRILVEEEELKPFGTGVISHKFFTNPFSHARNWNDMENGVYLPSEIAVVHKYDSLDTPANRFLKFALNSFFEICENIEKYIKKADEKSSAYYDEAIKVKNYISDTLNDSFFDDVQDLTVMPVNNQVLEKREGYAQIFKAFSMVDLALQLDWKGKEDVYAGEAKNTALLYEYWLFFELRKIISRMDGCKAAQPEEGVAPFINDSDGLTISLRQDSSSVQKFEIEKQFINLYYNRTFSRVDFEKSKYEGSYSRPFRPDYTVAIFSKSYKSEKAAMKDGAVSYIHFDAKYRLEDLCQFINPDDTVAEEELKDEKSESVVNTYKRGDLLKMHTYNDAIRRTVGSYVLYPGSNETDGKWFSVYEEILPGVGAFAIRPSTSGASVLNAGERAVQNFITQIVNFNANPAGRISRTNYFENMIAETPSEGNAIGVPDSESDLTMIGFVREEYFNYLREKNIIPARTSDISCLEKEFYFYYHAIKNGIVYTLHKETSRAKYLRLTLTDNHNAEIIEGKKFEKLEPWSAEILSSELVSKQKLQETLSDYPGKNKFQADFYYLVKAKITSIYEGGIVAVSTEENNIISPYSPKIVELV